MYFFTKQDPNTAILGILTSGYVIMYLSIYLMHYQLAGMECGVVQYIGDDKKKWEMM